MVDSVTPNKGDDEIEKTARRRNLAQSFQQKLASTLTAPAEDPASKGDEDIPPPLSTITKDNHETGCTDMVSVIEEVLPTDEEILLSLGPVDPVPISPLPATPQKPLKASQKPAMSVTSPRLKVAMEECKQLQKRVTEVSTEMTGKKVSKQEKVVAPEVLRERLVKCGKLDTLKSKLAEMNSTLKAVRKIEADKNKARDTEKETEAELTTKTTPQKDETATNALATEKKTAPAYERHEYLAKEGLPYLALPGKYQRLFTTFQSSDTVVSMLYNRQEVISFSKLKAAVQSMTRKNFEQKALGQMKTVYPTAYNFSQERNLPSFGTKVSGYQLTIQPNLESLGKQEQTVDTDGKPKMLASALLKRKRIFHNSLVNITKDHHANFLSKLNPSLKVPSSKITRWHPRFALDSVPDIDVSELPAPPVKVYQTAKQVLDAAKGKLPTRVEEAMSNVAEKSNSSQPVVGTSTEEQKPAPVSTKPTTSAYKGIPLALLEKIRAKEAAKTQAALMRDPKEDKKTEMMGRLPNLIRSLRTFYVTEKKPSLPMTTVIEKLADSYSTCISPAEVESHLALLQELAPKWLQVIQIARGKYVKIDKNMDISTIISRITNLAKSRK